MPKSCNSYMIAVVATVVVATGLPLVELFLGEEFNFLQPFTLAVTVAAWHGGLWCGLFATLLNLTVGAFLTMHTESGWEIAGAEMVRIALFLGVGITTQRAQ